MESATTPRSPAWEIFGAGWRSELGGKLKRQQCGPLRFFVAPYRDEDGQRRESAKKCFWAVMTEDIIGSSVRRRFFREVESALMR